MQSYFDTLDNKMTGLLSEMIGNNGLQINSITISAIYYEKYENLIDRSAGHRLGMAIDIVGVTFKNRKEDAFFDDPNNNIPENDSVKAVFNWLVGRNDVKDVYTPWQIKSGTYGIKMSIPNVWSTDKTLTQKRYDLMFGHRNHLHLRLY